MKLVRDAMAGLHFLQCCTPLLKKLHSHISWWFLCFLSLEPCVLYLERQCYFSDTITSEQMSMVIHFKERAMLSIGKIQYFAHILSL
jgi:hypothetical protein